MQRQEKTIIKSGNSSEKDEKYKDAEKSKHQIVLSYAMDSLHWVS